MRTLGFVGAGECQRQSNCGVSSSADFSGTAEGGRKSKQHRVSLSLRQKKEMIFTVGKIISFLAKFAYRRAKLNKFS